MDPEIWGNLPIELVRKILDHARDHLSIDARLAFNLKPKKISEPMAWRLWYLLDNDGIFYNLDTKTLHNLRVQGTHIVRRPIEISYLDDGLSIFNLYEKEYALEISNSKGEFMFDPSCKQTFATEKRVILKGSSMVETGVH
jgi:hypothetical protein